MMIESRSQVLTKIEKKILASVQKDIPITEHPYLEIAEGLEISEKMLLEKLKGLCDRGIIRRFGATIRHQKSGFAANAMIAWKVDERRVYHVGQKMASFRQVSHCYKRKSNDKWPYNLYTMIHARDEESCLATARKMSEETSVDTYTLLFSRRELKKTSMEYFPTAS